jgi:hypothetical protein
VHAVRVGLNHGMGEIFLIGLIVGVLAFASTFLLPEMDLKHDEFFEDVDGGAATAPADGSHPAAEVRAERQPVAPAES